MDTQQDPKLDTGNNHYRFQKTRPTIGVLLQGGVDNVARLRSIGITEAAKKYDVNLFFFSGEALQSPYNFSNQANVIYNLVDTQCLDGLIIFSDTLNWFIPPQEMEAFCQRYLPLPAVSIGVAMPDMPSILSENYQGMRQAMIHLIEEHGYQRLAFIRGLQYHSGIEQRYQAYKDTLAEYGLSFNPQLVTDPTYWYEGAGAVDLFLDERNLRPHIDFEVLIGANDKLAFGALDALHARGINVPDEVALVGFDNLGMGRSVTPPLTTVGGPYYDTGWQAVAMVLAQLRGEAVPEQVVLPTELKVRQSCGCKDQFVVQAAKETSATLFNISTSKIILAEQQPEIISQMEKAVEESARGIDPTWAQKLFDAFTAGLKNEPSRIFLDVLNNTLSQALLSGENITAWYRVVSILRIYALADANSNPNANTTLLNIEDICQQANVMIGRFAQRAEAHKAARTIEESALLHEISSRLLAALSINELIEVLTQGLPRLNIPSAYLSLYKNPQNPTDEAQLIFAYNRGEQIEFGETYFSAPQLIPPEIISQEQRFSLFVEPLYFKTDQLGFVLFEIDTHIEIIYDMLRRQIGSALKSMILLEEREHARQALTQAYSQIETQVKERTLTLQLEISERKQAQQEIIHLQHLLQNITDSMPSALITLDLTGKILTYNPAAETLIAKSAAMIQDQILWDTCPFLKRYQNIFSTVITKGEVIHLHKEQLITETDTYYCNVSIYPLEANNINGAVFRLDDVTQRVQLEEMMLQATKMASIGGLAAGVAHEINNPLGAMMQSAQILQIAFNMERPRTRERVSAYDIDPDKLALYLQERELLEYLDGIRTSGERAAKIVTDLLSFSRKKSEQITTHNWNDLIESTLALAKTDYDLKKQYDFRDIKIIQELTPNLPPIICDKQQIQQVILNLVRNAAQAMAQCTNPQYHPRLTLRSSLVADTVSRLRCEVEDNGPGVPEEIKDRLFEPFFTTKTVGYGTGLGLWLCWSIVVEHHKGKIWAEPVESGGSCFIIEVPVGQR